MTRRLPPADLPASDRNARFTAATAILAFSFSLGTGMLVLPLLAVAAGYDVAAVGFFTAASAVAQFVLRLLLPWLFARFPDRLLIGVSCLFLAGSYAMLLASTALLSFVAAQLLQGAARGLFWTSSQTHAVRGSRQTVKALAETQLVGNVGTLSGPAVAGLVAAQFSLEVGLAIGLGAGVAGAGLSLLMTALPPFERQDRRGQTRIWRRPGVDVGCWAGFTAGGWRAMLGSYVPVILDAAGQSPSVIGSLLALADAAALGMTTALVRLTVPVRRSIDVGILTAALGLGLLPLVASAPALAAAVLALGGLGSGVLTTLGPAIASDSVEPHERGDALAAAGTFRAAAILVTPAAVAVLLSVIALPVAMVIAAAGMGIPAVATSARRRTASPHLRLDKA